MRIAYLITAYGEWGHLERMVGALDAPGVGFFIHIDAKSSLPEGLVERLSGRGNVTFAERRKVWWGGWSHTAAILSLMEHACGGDGNGLADRDYCVILSGADYPVRSNEAIREALASGGEFINAAPGFRPGKPENRVARYWFDGFDRRRRWSLRTWLGRGAELTLRALGIRKRHYPFEQVYSGVVWGALSGACVRYILNYIRSHPRYVSFFRTALVPEEMFFATIVGGSPFGADIRGTITLMDWDHDGASPPHITLQDMDRLVPRMEGRLFARKFDDAGTDVLDYIDARLRNRPEKESV
jgi:hypothetical protein